MSAETTCGTCGGRGQLTQRERVGESDFNEWDIDCPVCDGVGHAPECVQNHIAFLNSRIAALKKEAHDWWSAAASRPPASSERVALSEDRLEAAAKVLAQCMDYPWSHMPEKGRDTMRNNVKLIIEAAQINPVPGIPESNDSEVKNG